jgi:hypothetical protein
MSQENVELVRSLIPSSETEIAALLRSDELFGQLRAGFEELVDPEVECVAVWQGGTTYRGIDGFRKLLLDWLEPWTSYHIVVDDLIDAGDVVVALARDWGGREGVEGRIEILGASTWQIRDGKVVKLQFYGSRGEALAAAGVEQK